MYRSVDDRCMMVKVKGRADSEPAWFVADEVTSVEVVHPGFALLRMGNGASFTAQFNSAAEAEAWVKETFNVAER